METVTLFKPLDPAQRPLAMRRGLPAPAWPQPEALTGAPVLAPDAAALLQWGRDTAGLPLVWDVWRRRIACFLSTWQPSGGRAEPGVALLHAVAMSLDRFCQECTGAREFREHAAIPAALIEIWQTLLHDGAPVRPSVDHRLVAVHGRAPDAARRRAVGHQLLTTLTQGQIVSLLSYERLVPSPSAEQTRAFLLRTARLCQAGAAAYRFAADRAHDGDPPMAHTDPGDGLPPQRWPESGRSEDHRHLVSVVTRLRPALARARSVCPEEHAAMVEAVSRCCIERRRLQTRPAGAPVSVSSSTTAPAQRRLVPERPRAPASPPRELAITTRHPPRTVAAGSLGRLLTRLTGTRVPTQA